MTELVASPSDPQTTSRPTIHDTFSSSLLFAFLSPINTWEDSLLNTLLLECFSNSILPSSTSLAAYLSRRRPSSLVRRVSSLVSHLQTQLPPLTFIHYVQPDISSRRSDSSPRGGIGGGSPAVANDAKVPRNPREAHGCAQMRVSYICIPSFLSTIIYFSTGDSESDI